MPTRHLPWIAIRSAAAAAILALATTTASAATFVVTTTADTNDTCDADCSLREAITAANGSAGPHTIAFNIPGGGVRTITLASALPNITQRVTIDGYTQPGSSPNTNATGAINAVPLIEVKGSGSTPTFSVRASNSVVRGLVVSGALIPIEVTAATGVVIAGNFIGSTADGLATSGAAVQSGIRFDGGSGTVGGLTPADRNLVTGSVAKINNEAGIVVFGGSSVVIVGNLIGMDKTGTVAIPAGEAGIAVAGVPGLTGIPNVVIGGNTPAHRNVISGMSSAVDGGVHGILIATCAGCLANNVTIQGNFIGTTADGSAALPNFHGIALGAAATTEVGGTDPGEGNLIRFNLGRGIRATQDAFDGNGFRILGNSIHGNGSLGIDLLGGAGIPNDVNDVLDADPARQNYPVLTSLTFAAGAVTIGGTLESAASKTYRLEFFANDAADASSFGEGQTFLGSVDVTTDGSGNASFITPALGTGLVPTQFITATATDVVTGDTSEFSQLTADLAVTISDAPDPAVTNSDVTYTMTVTNLGPVHASGDVTLFTPIPTGATLVSAAGGTPSGGSVNFNVGTLAVGQSAQRQMVVRFATTGSKGANVTAASTVSDTVGANNVASTTTTVTAPVTLSISGTVRTGTNLALAGVTLTLTGPGITTRTTTSSGTGTYSFANLPGGSYVVTPSIAGRVFEPASRTYTNITTTQINQDYVGRLVWTISGQVRDLNDTGVAGVTMTLSGDQAATTTTDLNGNYQFMGIVNGRTVTVTPTKATFAFNPPSQTFANISKDEVAGFFVAQVGTFTRYFAEGATGPFFDTQIALLNATGTPSTATVKFQKPDGSEVTQQVQLAGIDRKTILPESIAGLENAAISTEITSDQPLIADRTMTWDDRRYGSHAETSIGRPLTRWFLAEGATISGFDLFYLVQNPNTAAANVQVRYLLKVGQPITRTYQVPARSRFNIWVNLEDPLLAAAEVSADITSDVPVIVERAMYRSISGQQFTAGHEGAGVEAPALQWFFAEGATGAFFDLFFLIANPANLASTVDATYLKPDGSVVTRSYTIEPNSRFNIWVDLEDPALASTALGATFRVTNGVPVVVERAMWWPGAVNEWVEGHNTVGATATGEKWALAEGEVSGAPFFTDTYILVANTSATTGTVRVTLVFDDGSAPVSRDFPIAANARLNVAASAEFPAAVGRRFGAIVESVGTPVQLVVERAMYNTSDGVTFAAGTASLGTRLR